VRTYPAVMPAGRYSMRGLVCSEWMKLRTVRSTMWTLGTTAFVGLGASAIAMGVVEALPDPLQYEIERLLPIAFGSAMINDPAPHGFGPWVGLSILCGYAVLVLALGTLLFVRRDA